MKAFVIDVSKGTGCYCCQIVCKDEHVGNDWTPYAKPQPDTGPFFNIARQILNLINLYKYSRYRPTTEAGNFAFGHDFHVKFKTRGTQFIFSRKV